MADVNVKTIETRLQLKYDTYANWTNADLGDNKGANLVLLKGEIGIVEIEAKRATDPTVQTPAPTVLFKVGDGEHKFSELNWASALAADVYAWAKAETVVFNSTSKKVEFKTGETVIHDVDLSHFAEASTVADHNTRIADLEAALGIEGDSEESIAKQIADIVEKLGVIQGADTVEGSIAKALNDAKAYTDEVVGVKAEGEAPATGLRKEIADAQAAAEATAKTYTDGEVDKLEAKDAELLGKIGENTTAIGNEATARQEADKAITDIIGEGFTTTDTVAVKVKAAQDAADAAQADVDALVAADGAVTKNTADIAQLKSNLSTETSERKAADEALDNRLKEVEAFFEGAAEDSEGLNDALDKLVDIQTYLSGDGSAAGDLVGQVSANAQAIKTLQDTLAEGGDFEKRVDDVEAAASTNAGNITTLQDIVDGYTDKGSVKTAIEAAKAQADKGVEDAGKAQAAADKAQGDVDTLALVVNDEATGLAATKDIADKAAADVAALAPKVEQAEKDIDALEAIVKTGENTNAQLRADIEALEAIVVTGADANATLGGEIDAIAAKVNDEKTGLAVTNAAATDAQSRVAAIEADYLKASDVYIFNCGSSTDVTHVAPTAN